LSGDGNDQLTILYDADALAGMGQHKRWSNSLKRILYQKWVSKNIRLVGLLPKCLSVSVSELLRADPGKQPYADLWSKYFPSIEIGNSFGAS
jgi:hypothetical protein